MISLARFFGGARYSSSGVDFTLNWYGASTHTVNATAGGVDVTLPPTTAHDLGAGGPVFLVLNVGANSFDLLASGGGAVATVPAGDAAILSINASGGWSAMLLDVL